MKKEIKTQIVILKVKYEENNKKPSSWDWNNLIECEECIELLNYGSTEYEKQ
jgi:hypothetical protein